MREMTKENVEVRYCCGRVYKTETWFLKHRKGKHQGKHYTLKERQVDETEIVRFMCRSCGNTFKTLSGVQKHCYKYKHPFPYIVLIDSRKATLTKMEFEEKLKKLEDQFKIIESRVSNLQTTTVEKTKYCFSGSMTRIETNHKQRTSENTEKSEVNENNDNNGNNTEAVRKLMLELKGFLREAKEKGFPIRAMLKEREPLIISKKKEALLEEKSLVVMQSIKSKAYLNA